jgi:hypothetical protein
MLTTFTGVRVGGGSSSGPSTRALSRSGSAYSLEPYEASPNRQRIRTPLEILQTPGQGTCVGLALLFCGLCLGYDLLPILIVLDRHAFVAVSLRYALRELTDYGRKEKELFADGLLCGDSGRGGLRRLLESGDYLAIECTGFTHSETLPETCPEGIGRVGGYLLFEQAVKAGLEHLSAPSRAFEFALDVAVLHNVGLTPLEVLPGAIEVRRDDVAIHVAPVVAPVEREPTRPRGIEFDTIHTSRRGSAPRSTRTGKNSRTRSSGLSARTTSTVSSSPV